MKLIRARSSTGRVSMFALLDDGTVEEVDGAPLGPWRYTGRQATISEWLPPVEPAQIIGIGLNYAKHAAEAGLPRPDYPVVFFKGLGSLQGPGASIELPGRAGSDKVDYEAELAVVIGRSCSNVRREEALSYVAGYTCANDVSARDWQLEKGGSQWSKGKSFDTFCPLGPVLVTTDEIENPNDLGIRTRLNDELVQDAHTSDMIFDVPAIIEFLSTSATLVPGTVILTGTPHGVAGSYEPNKWLKAGDLVSVEIDGIGALTNQVV